MNTNLIQVKNNKILTTSLLFAEKFNEQHKNVLRKIEALLYRIEDRSIFIDPMFERSDYINEFGETLPMYYINRDGFTLLVMSYTGIDSIYRTLEYIAAFNAMEDQLGNVSALRVFERLYPESYFTSLEYTSDLNTSYRQWIEDYNITREYIEEFPTIDIFNQYVRYCIDRRLPSMSKKMFYKTLEFDFNLTPQQSDDGLPYFISA